MASGLAVALSFGPSCASRCFLLFPGFLAGIQLNLSYNSIRIQPVPCLAVSRPWQPFVGCFATALLQPQPAAPLCPQVVPAPFTSECPCTSSHGLLLPWDLPSSCRLELSSGSKLRPCIFSPSLLDSEPLLPASLSAFGTHPHSDVSGRQGNAGFPLTRLDYSRQALLAGEQEQHPPLLPLHKDPHPSRFPLMQFSRKILSDLWTLIWDLESRAVALESVRAVGFCGTAGHFLLPPWERATHPGLVGNAGSPLGA